MTTLPKLDYNYNELEPHIDANTMEIHHSKHHQAYITKFDAAVDGTPLANQSLSTILSDKSSIPSEIKNAVINNGGGHINHSLFWTVIGPNAGGSPTGKLADEINSSFGSFDSFKSTFETTAATQFGSGWAWLCVNSSGSLVVTSTANQDNPISDGLLPILGLDVWEHAYYLNYQNRRPDYISAFWNIVAWNIVSDYFEKAKQNDTSYLV